MIAQLLEGAGKSIIPVKKCLLAATLITFGVSTASAQYEVREWANFEDGKLPPELITIGGNWQTRMQVVATDSITTQSEAFRNPEVGKYVLRLDAGPIPSDAATWQLGLAIGDVLDRSKLGPKGRALFQADFFVEPNHLSSMAVLAMEAPKDVVNNHVDTIKTSFYRFGMTKTDRTYFSQVTPNSKTAKRFEQDKTLFDQIPVPGWHALQSCVKDLPLSAAMSTDVKRPFRRWRILP